MKSKTFELRCDDEFHTFRLYRDGSMEIEDFDLEEATVLQEMGYHQGCLKRLEHYREEPLEFLILFSPFMCGDNLRLLIHGVIVDYYYIVREAVPRQMDEQFSKMLNVIEEGEGYENSDWVWAKNMIRNWTKRAKEKRWRREDKAMHPIVVVGRGPDPVEERRVQKICLAVVALYARSQKGRFDCKGSRIKWVDAPVEADEIIEKVRSVARDIAEDEVAEYGGATRHFIEARERSDAEFNQDIFERSLSIIFEED